MMVFDIETDGLRDEATKIHCLCMLDPETGREYSCTDSIQPDRENGDYEAPERMTLDVGIRLLFEQPEICGHNVINFDIPVIERLSGRSYEGKVRDTLVLSRMLFGNLQELDEAKARSSKPYALPRRLYGRHGLEAWGYRLAIHKGELPGQHPFAHWSPEMQRYCEQDVRVTNELRRILLKHVASERSVELEHEFAAVIARQERTGALFDVEGARALAARIEERLAILWETLAKEIDDLRSRTRIIEFFRRKYGWTPTETTEKGNPRIDSAVLERMDYPEAKLLSEYWMLGARLALISNGPQNLLSHVRSDGRIRGSVNTCGTVTARCTHFEPNLAQIPAAGTPLGTECRSLFVAPPGMRMVGADVSGLELRCLAHYLERYDGGAFARELVEGDIHTANMVKAGLGTRNDAKRFIYAFLYGAGDSTIGAMFVPPGSGEDEKKEKGREIRERFLSGLPALRRLREDVERRVTEKKRLIALDGRVLPVRSTHAALNVLLQSAGSIVVKTATVLFWRTVRRDIAVEQALHIHDEVQLYAEEEHAEYAGRHMVECIREAGVALGMKCPLDGEYRIGGSWAETH